MSDPIQDQVLKNSKPKHWWSLPLRKLKSLIVSIKQWLKQLFFRAEVPDNVVAIYQDDLQQLRNVAAIAKTIDSEKFSSQEFIFFLSINLQVNQNIGVYEGLKNSIDLLRVALETKDSFLKIEAIETRYRSYSQQDFYNYVFELLGQDLSKDDFKGSVQTKLVEVISKIKTEEGKTALQSYSNQLDILSKDELGLRLLLLFKQYHLTDFSLLRHVAEIADAFYDKNLESIKEFAITVKVNAEIFIKLGQIIQVPESQNTPNTYALILQYIALINRHKNAYAQFQQLIQLLKNWQKFYKSILAIRKEYPANEYKQPSLFHKEIPGLTIYKKYQGYLESSS